MSADLLILRETLETALASDGRFPARFYEILFARRPDLEALFVSNSRTAQVRNFGKKLVAIVDHLDDPEFTERELASLAKSHVGYGVTAEMFVPVGDALIDTLREACGEDFTTDAERAWRNAYASIAAAMTSESPR
jgi:hemoglobin-like flavoprotein